MKETFGDDSQSPDLRPPNGRHPQEGHLRLCLVEAIRLFLLPRLLLVLRGVCNAHGSIITAAFLFRLFQVIRPYTRNPQEPF